MFGWGANSYGQLGIGHISEQEANLTNVISADNSFTKIVGGGGHSLAVDDRGDLHVCGWNNVGQLGLGSEMSAFKSKIEVFTKVNFNGTVGSIIDLAAGWDFSLILHKDGQVSGCGSNRFNQLGAKKEQGKEFSEYRKIAGLNSIIGISAGLRHAAAVDKDGVVYTWGSGSKGQLGRTCTDEEDCMPRPLKLGHIATSVSCGQYFTLIRTSEGELFGFGDNKYNQLSSTTEKGFFSPIRIPLSPVDFVSCGWTHVSALKIGKGVFTWGRNNYHQCGNAKTDGENEPPRVDMSPLPGTEGVVKVVSGSEHCISLDTEGQVYTWGWNEHANCGFETAENLPMPTLLTVAGKVADIFVGSAHCFMLR